MITIALFDDPVFKISKPKVQPANRLPMEHVFAPNKFLSDSELKRSSFIRNHSVDIS